jgi:hypothetical protein
VQAFKTLKYTKFYKRCIADRQKMGVGRSPEFNTLFRFWSMFLRDDFRDRMYADFKQYAEEDVGAAQFYGLECLLRFYSCCKLTATNRQLYADFEATVLKYYKMGNLYGLRLLCRFHESGLANTAEGTVVMGPQIRDLVDKLGKDLMRPASATISVPQHKLAPPAHIIAAAPAQSCTAATRIVLPPAPPAAHAAPSPRKAQLRPDAKEFVCCPPVRFTLPDRLGLDLGD